MQFFDILGSGLLFCATLYMLWG